jgi:putative tryptophan/tyrosine transport system substrate-binding protein
MERRGSRWSRRAFVMGAAGLGLVAGCGQWPGQAQPTPRVPRVGYLALGTGPLESVRAGLREYGYVDGQNVAFEPRSAEGDGEQLTPLAAELVALPVDVIVTVAAQATSAAIAATTTTPIVAVGVSEAVEGEIGVTSLGRPGGNVTGTVTISAQLSGKRLELLKEAYPRTALA